MGYVTADVRELVATYDQALEQRDQALHLVEEYQATLSESEREKLRHPKSLLQQELTFDTLPRLEPFLRSESDASLSPQEKLALAYSGWVLGSAGAVTDLSLATHLWDARPSVLAYLREDNPGKQKEILEELAALSDVSTRQHAEMVQQLPPVIEDSPVTPGVPLAIELETTIGGPRYRYTVILPPEYSPHRKYPLLCVLPGDGRTTVSAAQMWAGDAESPGPAARRGWIVVSPEHCDPKSTQYDYDVTCHEKVIAALRDLRQRWHIDSDRIVLTGHGLGGDACFDIALSHPDLFAGVVPFTGRIDGIAKHCKLNGPDLKWYVVGGQRDRDCAEVNAPYLTEMVFNQRDIVYCQFKERGHEAFTEEQPRILDWLDFVKRPALRDTKKIETKLFRSSDSHLHWVEARSFPARAFQVTEEKKAPISVEMKGTIPPNGNIVYVKAPSDRVSVWLSPELIDYETRVRISINGEDKFSELLQPRTADLLEDLRVRADRERLFWNRIDFPYTSAAKAGRKQTAKSQNSP